MGSNLHVGLDQLGAIPLGIHPQTMRLLLSGARVDWLVMTQWVVRKGDNMGLGIKAISPRFWFQ